MRLIQESLIKHNYELKFKSELGRKNENKNSAYIICHRIFIKS